MLEVAHALRQRLHFTQPLVDLFEPVSHLLEALAEPRFQRVLQLFIDSTAHLVELVGITLLQLRELLFQRFAHFAHTARI